VVKITFRGSINRCQMPAPAGGSMLLLAGWLAATSFLVRRVVRNYR
jgi:hypothetical protein